MLLVMTTQDAEKPVNPYRERVTYSVRTAERFDIAHRTTLQLAAAWHARCLGSLLVRDDGAPLSGAELRRIAEETTDYD
jgi:hypothetical protein